MTFGGKRSGVSLAAAMSLAVLAGCSASIDRTDQSAAPIARSAEVTSAVIEAKPYIGTHSSALVAAANPLAVDAGIEVLAAGGSAVDAAIAVQAVLGLVEPQSSGLGGGAFLVHYDASTGDVVTYDGREIAPRGATPDMFLDAEGRPLDYTTAIRSGRSVGVPGAVAMLEMAHRAHGRLPWRQPWQRAATIASEGFEVSPRLHQIIGVALERGPLPPAASQYLTIDGVQALPVGTRLTNLAYAKTVRAIADQGAQAFYTGEIAKEIVAAVREGAIPGSLDADDLTAYQPTKLEPLCGGYRVYLVCGMRPPSSGGVAVLSVLGTLQNFDMTAMGPTVQGWHHLIEAQRLAYADRDMYVADDRFEAVPLAGLIDKDYLRSRAALILADKVMERAEAGNPPGSKRRGQDATGGITGTSHFVIVDRRGNVVSMTTTVESLFGSLRMAGGFFLNNQLTDFSFKPFDDRGVPIANAVAPGKKPRSSMSPTIVFRDGQFELAVGSPGGNNIIAYVSKSVVGMLDWNLSPQAAIELPNMIARRQLVVERGRADPIVLEGLTALGHDTSRTRGGEASGLHAVRRLSDGRLEGAADPRREGKVGMIP